MNSPAVHGWEKEKMLIIGRSRPSNAQKGRKRPEIWVLNPFSPCLKTWAIYKNRYFSIRYKNMILKTEISL
jgi:hypothetical protein